MAHTPWGREGDLVVHCAQLGVRKTDESLLSTLAAHSGGIGHWQRAVNVGVLTRVEPAEREGTRVSTNTEPKYEDSEEMQMHRLLPWACTQ